VIANVRGAWRDAPPYLSYRILPTRCRWRWAGRGCGTWRAATHWRLDRNHYRRACLEEANRRIDVLRWLIGVKPEIIQRAPTDRIGVLILRKSFAVPGYRPTRLSDSPRLAAVTLIV